ncbi:MAG: ATP-binding protein [Bacteroidales bacterium]|nr:ATP-binding protein [Bacteroidales bacterium]
MNNIKQIAITGPESTGKSQMARQLASHFNTVWVPEYAREYLENLGRPYRYEDILIIGRQQYQLQKEKLKEASEFIFYDTDFTVLKIWCEFKYGKCHEWIKTQFEKQPIDHYLLMNFDLPWEPDPQREHPAKRLELFDLYVNELRNKRSDFTLISGLGDQRLKHAIEAVEALR